MGLFSSKKKIYVSSVLYNLAGPEENRPDYLKTMVLGNMIGNRKFSIADTLTQGYLGGNGVKLRNFYNWAETNYTEVGIPRDSFSSNREIDLEELRVAISGDLGINVKIEWAEAGREDATQWALQWMYEYLPDRVDDDWEADFDFETSTIVINFDDGVTAPIMFPISGFAVGSQYIYASYQQSMGSGSTPLIVGPVVPLGSDGAFPSISGWNTTTTENIAATQRLKKTVISTATFSDGRPAEVTTAESFTTEAFSRYVGLFNRQTYLGMDPAGKVSTLQEFMRLNQSYVVGSQNSSASRVETLPGGVTKTINDAITQEILVRERSYQVSSQELIHSQWTAPKIYIYRQYSGKAELDKVFRRYVTADGYFPFIPIRINNSFVSKTNKPELYAQSKKAFKKALNDDYDKLVDKVADNPDLGDLDFAYIVFGISLNTKEPAGQKYIYKFFQRAVQYTQTSPADTNSWNTGVYDNYQSDYDAWSAWRDNAIHQNEVTEGGGGGGPVGPRPSEPTRPVISGPPLSNVRIKSDKSIGFDMEIDWESVVETTGTGQAWVGAKAGEFKFSTHDIRNLSVGSLWYIINNTLRTDTVKLYWQDGVATWRCLTIKGLVHKNYIWGGKFVETAASDALGDEEESSFIVPLNASIYKKMSIVDSTQLSTVCANIVFNCYQIVKKKWYQRGWFKVVLFVIVVVIIAMNPALGGAAGVGLFGANAAVGAFIGFTGLLATIAGVVANMIAAMIVTKLIGYVAVAAFGEELGMIIATIASAVTLQVGSALRAGQSLASMWGSMTSVMNIMQLTTVLGNGYAQALSNDAKKYAMLTQDVMKDYAEQTKELEERYSSVLGYGNSYIDPLSLTETEYPVVETSQAFVTRTLMTGSDIAELSNDMLTHFVDLTLSNALPT